MIERIEISLPDEIKVELVPRELNGDGAPDLSAP